MLPRKEMTKKIEMRECERNFYLEQQPDAKEFCAYGLAPIASSHFVM